MSSRFRHVTILAGLLAGFVVQPARSQDQQKTGASPSAKNRGTKTDVENRLKAQEKLATSTPLDGILKTLNAAHRFQQAAISPDGAKVAWVEILTGKDGAPHREHGNLR